MPLSVLHFLFLGSIYLVFVLCLLHVFAWPDVNVRYYVSMWFCIHHHRLSGRITSVILAESVARQKQTKNVIAINRCCQPLNRKTNIDVLQKNKHFL